MKILRIDDRLIHGQVIVGWVKKLGLVSLVLLHSNMDCDIIDLYASMLEEEVDFKSVNFTRDEIPVNLNAIYISDSINTVYENREKLTSVKFDIFNIGGLRTKAGKIKILDFVYLNKIEMERILELSTLLKAKTNAQELPESENFNIIKIIKEHL